MQFRIAAAPEDDGLPECSFPRGSKFDGTVKLARAQLRAMCFSRNPTGQMLAEGRLVVDVSIKTSQQHASCDTAMATGWRFLELERATRGIRFF
jgi:hypothetical protein